MPENQIADRNATQLAGPARAGDIYEDPLTLMAAAEQMGEMIAKSQIVKVANPAAGAIVALTCLTEGLSPIQFSRTFHLIGGKPTKQAKAMIVEFRSRGGKYKRLKHDSEVCQYEFTFEGYTDTYSLTWEDCKNSRWPWKDPNDHSKGLKDNWSTPMDRKNQLYCRLISETMSIICPEINFGIYTPEEMADVLGADIQTVPPAQIIDVDASPADEESIPAEFEVKTDPVKDGLSPVILGRLESLVERSGMTAEQVHGSLQKRNCSQLAELSTEQAEQMISQLEAFIRGK